MSKNETPSHLENLANPNRREALRCGAWVGAGLLWTLSGGVPGAALLSEAAAATPGTGAAQAGLSFIQISDTHIGFNKPANPDPLGTLRETIGRIRAMSVPPSFILHTGDITHLATPGQFDVAQGALSELGLPIHFVPGEHDIADGTNPQPYLDRFGAGSRGEGSYSFDAQGVHFIGLVNVVRLRDRGLGGLGEEQIAWLRDDVAHLQASTPIVVFAHMPLWALYPDWGWGTEDAAPALSVLSRFGSVTVLNGHIHQIQQQVEGNVTFHTARSTAYPQPAPGVGAGPGPLPLPADQLRTAIGISSVAVHRGGGSLAITDLPLALL